MGGQSPVKKLGIAQAYEEDHLINEVEWLEPKWQKEPLLHEGFHLSIKVKIQAAHSLTKNEVYILFQRVAKIKPIDAKLKLLSNKTYEYSATLYFKKAGNYLVQIFAEDGRNLIKSQALTVNFEPFRPNLHILSIGPRTTLDYAENDAQDFLNIFATQTTAEGGMIYKSVNANIITSNKATARNIYAEIEKLRQKALSGQIGRKDIVILFISSHGFLDKNGQLRLQGDDFDPLVETVTSVSFKEILETLKSIFCKKIIFIDACQSAGSKSQLLDVQFEELNREISGLSAMVSSRADEASYEDIRWRNGAFTEAIIEGLKGGKADSDGNSLITVDELWEYIKNRVPRLVLTVKNAAQHPRLLKNEMGPVPIYSIVRK